MKFKNLGQTKDKSGDIINESKVYLKINISKKKNPLFNYFKTWSVFLIISVQNILCSMKILKNICLISLIKIRKFDHAY